MLREKEEQFCTKLFSLSFLHGGEKLRMQSSFQLSVNFRGKPCSLVGSKTKARPTPGKMFFRCRFFSLLPFASLASPNLVSAVDWPTDVAATSLNDGFSPFISGRRTAKQTSKNHSFLGQVVPWVNSVRYEKETIAAMLKRLGGEQVVRTFPCMQERKEGKSVLMTW